MIGLTRGAVGYVVQAVLGNLQGLEIFLIGANSLVLEGNLFVRPEDVVDYRWAERLRASGFLERLPN